MNPPKIVQAPRGKFSCFTAGKNYEVIKNSASQTINSLFGYVFEVISDLGIEAICLEKKCSHLNEKDWIIIEREAEPTQIANDSTEEEAERLRNVVSEMLAVLKEAKEHLEWKYDFLIEDAEEGEENLYTRIKAAIQKATNP